MRRAIVVALLVVVLPASAAPPTASFTAPDSALIGQGVPFSDQSTDPDGAIAAWRWEFGDGHSSSEQGPVHAYSAAGNFLVRLTVTDNAGQSSSTAKSITIRAPESAGGATPPPEPLWVDAGPDLAVDSAAFTRLAARGPPEAQFSWRQTGGPRVDLFGPQTAQPSFTAPTVAPGEIVGLEFAVVASKDGHHSDADVVNVTVRLRNRAPVVDAGGMMVVVEGTRVLLQATASDPDGDRLDYAWTQVSGVKVALANDTTLAPSFQAPAAGSELKFRLEATDRKSVTLDTVVVLVEPEPRPDASFTFLPDARNPLRITARAEAPAGTMRWDMGDGTTLEGPLVTHTYAAAGTYEVRLRITLAGGQADEDRTTIVATAPLAAEAKAPAVDSWVAFAIGAGLLILAGLAVVVARTFGRR